MSNDRVGSKSRAALVFSVLFSLALGFLTVLAIWRFELRSISRLLLLSAPLTAYIWLLTFFLYFRKRGVLINTSPIMISFNAVSCILLSFHLIPPQGSASRFALAFVITSFSLFIVNQILLPFISKEQDRDWKTMLYAAVILLAGANLVVILFNAQFVRIYGDDFANVLKLERLGAWRAGLLFYQIWSGRFFSNFLVMGFSDKPWAPLLFLLTIQIILFITLRQFLKKDSFVEPLTLSFFIPLTIYTVTPDMYKSLYWNASAMTLLPQFAMLSIYLYLAYRITTESFSNPLPVFILSALLGFAITTCHESAAIGWVGMHVAGLIWLWAARRKEKRLRIFLWSGLAVSLAGLAVMLASPGAIARSIDQEYNIRTGIPTLLNDTTRFFMGFLRDIGRPIYPHHGFIRPGWLLLSGLFGLSWVSSSPFKRSRRSALFALLIALAMSLSAFLPGPVILGETIPYRTQFIPTMYLTLGIFFFGLLLPHLKEKDNRTCSIYFLFLILLTGAILNLVQLSRTVAPMRQYARDWDARDQLVRTTDALPRRLSVPWDEYEQNLGDFRRYYRTRDLKNE